MRREIKDLKHVKQFRDKLLQELLALQEQEQHFTAKIQECRMKQSKVAFEIEQAVKRGFDMIEDLR